MPTCRNCDQTWTWKQTMKTFFKLRCPYCGKKQYESASSRKRGGIFGVILSLLVMIIVVWFDISVSAALIFGGIVIAFIIGSYPFVLKLSDEEEHLF